MQMINLTPHGVNIAGKEFPASGQVARCAEVITSAGEVEGIPLIRRNFGAVEGLPPISEGTMYIVSAMVMQASPGRADLVCPGELIRDATGKVIGCKNLAVLK